MALPFVPFSLPEAYFKFSDMPASPAGAILVGAPLGIRSGRCSPGARSPLVVVSFCKRYAGSHYKNNQNND